MIGLYSNPSLFIGKYQLTAYAGAGTVYSLLDTSNGQLYKWVTLSKAWKKSGKPVKN